jgi:peroxiredoxin Q/BCP
MPNKSADTLEVGLKAPEFSLVSTEGKKISLRDFRGKKVVLYFYPKDMTPGCTTEACSFRDNIGAIRRKGAEVIGISADDVDLHKKFTAKYSLPFLLLSDEKREVVKAYGVWKNKSLYGRIFKGIERTTFIIDEEGTIAHIFPKVRVDGHTEEVLKVL